MFSEQNGMPCCFAIKAEFTRMKREEKKTSQQAENDIQISELVDSVHYDGSERSSIDSTMSAETAMGGVGSGE